MISVRHLRVKMTSILDNVVLVEVDTRKEPTPKSTCQSRRLELTLRNYPREWGVPSELDVELSETWDQFGFDRTFQKVVDSFVHSGRNVAIRTTYCHDLSDLRCLSACVASQHRAYTPQRNRSCSIRTAGWRNHQYLSKETAQKRTSGLLYGAHPLLWQFLRMGLNGRARADKALGSYEIPGPTRIFRRVPLTL